jgi:hypothetical protein
MEPEAVQDKGDNYTGKAYGQLISAQVMLPQGEGLVRAQVVGRKCNAGGNPIGTANRNPILDTRLYEVRFEDGSSKEYAANAIAENLYSQVNPKGNEFLLLEEIVKFRKKANAVLREDMYLDAAKRQPQRTTQGWDLLIQWKDGTMSWELLKNLKESNPVQVAEFAVLNGIADKATFAWCWIKDILRRHDCIISKVKARYWKKTHKSGFELPKPVTAALAIGKTTGTNFWAKAIAKEMKNVRPAFKVLDDGAKKPIGYKEIKCHMIFDVKMDFSCEAWFVAGGHMMDPPSFITYSSVVSHESVRITFTIAALNDLDVLCADISNAYLNAPCRKKCMTWTETKFGAEEG